MTQRLYLPKNTHLQIGAVNLEPAVTDFALVENNETEQVRAMGEDYSDTEWLGMSRALDLTGVYYGDQADALRALLGSDDLQPWRVVYDYGTDNRVVAGHCRVAGIGTRRNGRGPVVASGRAVGSGVSFIGSGLHTNLNALTVPVAFDTVIMRTSTAGAPTTGNFAVHCAVGGNQWTTNVALSEPGLWMLTVPQETTGGIARPTSGNWTMTVSLTGYTTVPTFEWAALQAEGNP